VFPDTLRDRPAMPLDKFPVGSSLIYPGRGLSPPRIRMHI
jgi:hypothetical protein